MGILRLLPLFAVVLVVCAGCSHEQRDVRTAVERSPLTYFRYAAARWWGRPVRVVVSRPHVDGNWAGAVVEVRAGKHVLARQQALVRRARKWSVILTSSASGGMWCGAAPRGFVRHFFGSCITGPGRLSDYAASSWVTGPRAAYPAGPRQRRAIVAVARRLLFHGHDNCVRYDITLSRVDSRYASVSYRFVPPYRGCLLGNGASLFIQLSTGVWRDLGEAGDAFPCNWGTPGAVRSLSGACQIEGQPGAWSPVK